MNVAIYGGTFDPVHLGHLAVARAAAERFKLGRIYFVPAEVPPHKLQQPLTPYYHRYAMLALALAGDQRFLPSLLEAPEILQAEHRFASYSIDTVRRLRARLAKRDKLFFLIGIDAFKDIAKWRSPLELLRECEFIVASRPQYSLAEVALSLPEELRPNAEMARELARRRHDENTLKLGDAVIHLLGQVHSPVSATKVRALARGGRPLETLVGPAVADYIRKERLYRAVAEPGSPEVKGRPQRAGLRIISRGRALHPAQHRDKA